MVVFGRFGSHVECCLPPQIHPQSISCTAPRYSTHGYRWHYQIKYQIVHTPRHTCQQLTPSTFTNSVFSSPSFSAAHPLLYFPNSLLIIFLSISDTSSRSTWITPLPVAMQMKTQQNQVIGNTLCKNWLDYFQIKIRLYKYNNNLSNIFFLMNVNDLELSIDVSSRRLGTW